ncbi:MAG: hypothetical protein J6D26_05065 [Clostridia bacterium]|nr:hypothetical protein [Clostridia bacterium]
MRKLTQKITSLLLGMVMILCSFNMVAFASGDETITTLTYETIRTVNSGSGDEVNSDPQWKVGKQGHNVTVFQFDLSALPEGETVTKAEFRGFTSLAVSKLISVDTFTKNKSISDVDTYNKLVAAGYEAGNIKTWINVFNVKDSYEQVVPDSGAEGEKNQLVLDITNAVQAAVEAGETYLNLVIRGANAYNELLFPKTYSPKPFVNVTTKSVTAPSVTITEPQDERRIKADTAFNVSAQVTEGSNTLAEENPVTVTVEPEVPELVVTPVLAEDGNYTWSLSGLPTGIYTIRVTAADNEGITGSDGVELETLGSQITSLSMVSDANGEPYNWQLRSVHYVAFQYDLSQISEGTISKVIWNFRTNSAIATQLQFHKILTQETFTTMPDFAVDPFYETPLTVADGLTEETWDGQTAMFFSVDMTDAVLDAIRKGERYFGFAVRAVQNRETIVISRANNPKPMLRVTSSTYKLPVIEGTVNNIGASEPFSTTITVSEGDAAVKSVGFYLNDMEISADMISNSGDEYTIEWVDGIDTPDDYVLKVVAEDMAGDKNIKELPFRVCGTEEQTTEEVIEEPLETGNTYKGNAWRNTNSWEADNDSLIAYFSYDLSEYKNSGIKSLIWSCPGNTYRKTVNFYETTAGWDSELIEDGVAPILADTPFAADNGVTSVDMTEYANKLISKGITTLSFAVKTADSDTLIIDKTGDGAPVMNITVSDNTRPVITGELAGNEYIDAGTEKTIDIKINEDGLVMDVAAKIDDVTDCEVTGLNDEYTVTIPALREGLHKLEISAEDNFGIKTVRTYILYSGTKPVSRHTVTDGTTASAAATDAQSGVVLILAAYKDGMLSCIDIDTAVSDSEDLSAELTPAETPDSYRSFVCDINLKPIMPAK